MLLVFDHYSFDEATRALLRGDEPVKVDPQQLELLALFLRHPGALLSRQQIIDAVWQGRAVCDSVLSVAIAKLRKALGKTRDHRDYIESSYGRGYRFVHEVTTMQPLSAAPVLPPRSASGAPLVGRAEAFGRLGRVAEQAQAGRGRLCLVTGEQGIGKTRLAASFAEHMQMRGGMRVAWACFHPGLHAPLEPVRQILRELARHGAVGQKAAALDVLLSDGKVVTHATLDALAQTLIEASRSQPLLLIFDGLHWTDSGPVSALTYLADALGRERIMIIAALRYERTAPCARRDVMRLWNHRNCQRIELGRLGAADVVEYVRQHLGEDSVDCADFARRLYERSEGHPFFMVELLRAVDLAQGRRLTAHVPANALAVLRERLRDLTLEARWVLRAAAVIGQGFDIGLLSQLTEIRADDLLGVLAAASDVQAIAAVPGATGAYRFEHALLRELLYSELSAHERGQLHLRAAHGLLERSQAGGAASGAELTHHILAAQPFSELDLTAYAAAASTSKPTAAAPDTGANAQRALELLQRSSLTHARDLAACSG